MANWTTACRLDDIAPEGVIRHDRGADTYAIYRSAGDEVFCTDGRCTHEAIHLSGGLVMDYEIECPKHGGVFDYRTGEAKRLPVCVNLRTYPARLEGGEVQIDVPG